MSFSASLERIDSCSLLLAHYNSGHDRCAKHSLGDRGASGGTDRSRGVGESHAYGTNVEGEIGAVLQLVESIHRTLHADGVPRVSLVMKMGTRADKHARLADKSVR